MYRHLLATYQRLRQRLAKWLPGGPLIPEALWQRTLANYPFLTSRSAAELRQLRRLSQQFLAEKTFTGTHGLEVTDDMAVAIAAQACLPLLHLGLGLSPYRDFKTVVLHPGAMVAKRQSTDAAGVVHRYQEVLLGEAMQGGPVALSWEDVAHAGHTAEQGHNVVIHEFAHKIDMQDGRANGSPPHATRAAQDAWQAAWAPAFAEFVDQVAMAERFGAPRPWLDAYGASAPAEFFAVCCEAYFVNPVRFAQEFPLLTDLLNAYFKPQAV